MAWENASINEINLGIDEGNTYWKSQSSSDSISQQSDFAGLTTNPVIPNNEFSTKFLIGDAQLGLRLYVSSSMCEWQPYKNGNAILPNLLSSPQPNSYYTMGVTLFIGYNDAIQEGQLMVKYYQDIGDPRYNQWTLKRSFTNYIEIYNWVKDMMNAYPIITYTWQSVSSISGKNGVSYFAILKSESINDGEAVSGASINVFDSFPEESNIKNMIMDVMAKDFQSVEVKYTISALKNGSYYYCKLVVKKNGTPLSVEDGDRVIDLDANAHSVIVSGLDAESHYYFVIFTEDDQVNTAYSDPKDCRTGSLPHPPAEYQQYIDRMNKVQQYGFTFKRAPHTWYYNYSTKTLLAYPAKNYSWFDYSSGYWDTLVNEYGYDVNDINAHNGILTLNITETSTSGVYRGEIKNIAIMPVVEKDGNTYQWVSFDVNSSFEVSGRNYGSGEYYDVPDAVQTGTLANILDWFANHFKNINVYFEGEPWAIVNRGE